MTNSLARNVRKFTNRLFKFASLCWYDTICTTATSLSSSVVLGLYNSSIVASGSRDNEWKKGVDRPKLVLKDCIRVVKFYLLDDIPEPAYEVLYGLFFMFQNSL